MDPYIVTLAGFGALTLLTAWLPLLLRNAPLSLPMICVGLGAALFALPGMPEVSPNDEGSLAFIERLTELAVVVSLMGAGLKLDRRLGWRTWRYTWRLLGLGMPLAILCLALLAFFLLGLGVATALLLAAVLAPTDPVLASDLQVGPPNSGEEDETRFALTSEAGLNDGLAFPFVHGAIALAVVWQVDVEDARDWFGYAVIWKIGGGLAMGYGVGRLLGKLLFHLPQNASLFRTGDGFVALGITFLAYGLTEMAEAYGFLAVFVAALTLRTAERRHEYHETLHHFTEELERLLMMALLVLLGGALSGGGLLRALSWEGAAFGLLAIFLVRPATAWVALTGLRGDRAERAAISFYGIRGIGSVYYLAYAVQRADFEADALLWSVVAFIVLLSIVLHGATATPTMNYLKARRGKPRPAARRR
jgi:NhaP-type Na+/H+ or K+/H+ antiporter